MAASGIACSPELQAAFVAAGKSAEVGMFAMVIKDDMLCEALQRPGAESDEATFAAAQGVLPEPYSEGCSPMYLCLQLPSQSAPANWVMMLYVPSGTTVRDRMLYASTKDSLKKELGASNFIGDIYGNTKDELTFAAYSYTAQADASGNAAALTEAEKEVEAMSFEESRAASGGATGGVSVAFAVSAKGTEETKKFIAGELAWVSLRVDVETETIEHCESLAAAEPKEWAAHLPEAEPVYVLLRVKASTAFVFYCPDSAPIKHKMLSSTVKSAAVEQLAGMSFVPDSNVEIRAAEEMTLDLMIGSGDSAAATKAPVAVKKAGVKGGRRMPKRR